MFLQNVFNIIKSFHCIHVSFNEQLNCNCLNCHHVALAMVLRNPLSAFLIPKNLYSSWPSIRCARLIYPLPFSNVFQIHRYDVLGIIPSHVYYYVKSPRLLRLKIEFSCLSNSFRCLIFAGGRDDQQDQNDKPKTRKQIAVAKDQLEKARGLH